MGLYAECSDGEATQFCVQPGLEVLKYNDPSFDFSYDQRRRLLRRSHFAEIDRVGQQIQFRNHFLGDGLRQFLDGGVALLSDGTLTLFSKANNVWQTILSVPNAPAYRSDPDAVNALRVTTIAGKIIIYLNGQLRESDPSPIAGWEFAFQACMLRSTRAWTEQRRYS